MPLALIVLALSAFAIGTTEFVIMGLLPEVANDLDISIPSAGWLVTAYALGVAIGAPIMAIVTARLPRKRALLALMAIFVIGNILCAMAPGFGFAIAARIVTALCHGAFFGIGSVVAASLVPRERRASAVALMFTGLTLANVLGVPLGTALGNWAGWRMTFWAVAVLGVLSWLGVAWKLPADRDEAKPSLKRELAALGNPALWIALFTTVLFAAAMFAQFTYMAPLLQEVTGLSAHGVTLTLLLIGVGLTVGNILGGKLADYRLGLALTLIFIGMTVMALILYVVGQSLIATEVALFLWAMFSFAAVPALQINVMHSAGEAENLAATLNISAFNAGNALGAWSGGLVIAQGFGLPAVSVDAAALSAMALLVTLLVFAPRRARAC